LLWVISAGDIATGEAARMSSTILDWISGYI